MTNKTGYGKGVARGTDSVSGVVSVLFVRMNKGAFP